MISLIDKARDQLTRDLEPSRGARMDFNDEMGNATRNPTGSALMNLAEAATEYAQRLEGEIAALRCFAATINALSK